MMTYQEWIKLVSVFSSLERDKMARAIQILKAISMFDPEEDYDDTEARDKLAILFREIIKSDEPQAKEFLDRFLSGVDNVIADMGIIEKPEEAPSDEVDLPDDDELGPEDEGPEEPMGEPEATADVERDAEEGEEEEEIPDELLGAGYDPLVSRANSFLYT